MMTTTEPPSTLEYKLLQKGFSDVRENYHLIGEGYGNLNIIIFLLSN